jgi:hypothetical protein
MQKIKIFLASSSELKDDRNGFEIFVNRKNKELFKRKVFLELVIWEDFLDAVSKTRLQDEYNKAISNSDIFLMMFFTRVGKYTEEEFEKAFKEFQANNKPFIFTYFKDAPISTSEITDDIVSLVRFKKKLSDLGHFFSTYRSIDELTNKFNSQLQKLEDESFLKFDFEKPGSQNTETKITQFHSGSGDNVAGNKIVNK